jgi:putative FmdB family regulatory protein
MPIYVYEPTIYSEQEQVHECCYFEALQNISEPPLTVCPTCGHAIHKAVTAFYVKDNIPLKNSSISGKGEDTSFPDSSASSSAKNAAKLAARHLCGAGCRH